MMCIKQLSAPVSDALMGRTSSRSICLLLMFKNIKSTSANRLTRH